jgi:hypothetical protein
MVLQVATQVIQYVRAHTFMTIRRVQTDQRQQLQSNTSEHVFDFAEPFSSV